MLQQDQKHLETFASWSEKNESPTNSLTQIQQAEMKKYEAEEQALLEQLEKVSLEKQRHHYLIDGNAEEAAKIGSRIRQLHGNETVCFGPGAQSVSARELSNDALNILPSVTRHPQELPGNSHALLAAGQITPPLQFHSLSPPGSGFLSPVASPMHTPQGSFVGSSVSVVPNLPVGSASNYGSPVMHSPQFQQQTCMVSPHEPLMQSAGSQMVMQPQVSPYQPPAFQPDVSFANLQPAQQIQPSPPHYPHPSSPNAAADDQQKILRIKQTVLHLLQEIDQQAQQCSSAIHNAKVISVVGSGDVLFSRL